MQKVSQVSEGTPGVNYTFHLHPDVNFNVLAIGDRVFHNHSSLKLLGLAVVVNLPCDAEEALASRTKSADGARKEGDWRPGRVQIRMESGLSAWVAPTKLTKILPANRSVVICGETDEFRLLARTQPVKTDFVADLGCSAGMATRFLASRARRVVGIDISEEMVEQARKNVPGVQFEVVDILEDQETLKALCDGVDKVFVDIGGVREAPTVARLLLQVPQLLEPQLIVVKSRYLLKLARAWCSANAGGGVPSGTIPDAETWLRHVAATPLASVVLQNCGGEHAECNRGGAGHQVRSDARQEGER